MVPDLPTSNRRRFLKRLGGGLAALGGGTVVVGATEPTALPDPVTDAATKYYPTPPEVGTLWRPTVTEAHAREAVDLLAETADRSETLWERIGTVESDRAPVPVDAGGWLADARTALQNGNHHKALSDAAYGIQFAGEGLGYARARLDQTDRATLAERGANLTERARAVASDLKPYLYALIGRAKLEEQPELRDEILERE